MNISNLQYLLVDKYDKLKNEKGVTHHFKSSPNDVFSGKINLVFQETYSIFKTFSWFQPVN